MLKEFLKNNEENAISFITILLIIIGGIVIILNWVFLVVDFTSEETVINSYEEVDYEEVMTEEYTTKLNTLLSTKNSDELYKKIDLNYLDENGLTEENFKTYLLQNELIGNDISILSSSCFSSGDVYVFRFYYKNYSSYKYVNVIETSPDEYYISFDQELTSVSDVDLNYTATVNDVTAEVVVGDVTDQFVKLNLKMVNGSDYPINVNFNSINSFILFGDDFEVTLSAVVAKNISELASGSYVNRELSFEISIEDFQKCEGLKIRNIMLNDEYFDIIIYF